MVEKESEIIARYAFIEDRQERLAVIFSQRLPLQVLHDAEKSDDLLVPGCVSRVWLRIAPDGEMLIIHYAAESALLRGLVGLFAELYHGATVSEAARYHPILLEALGLTHTLSATRLKGLSAVVEKIQKAARKADVDRRS